jgi:proline dehydrogenase
MRAILLPSRILRRQPFVHSPIRAFSAPIDFSDTKLIFESKSTFSLVRAYFVFQSCRIQSIVDNAEKLLRASYSILGDTLTDKILKKTYFAHFCAGEDEREIIPVVNDYERHGIGSILDYAAESDISDDTIGVIEGLTDEEKEINTRTYMYQNEALCDDRALTFDMCLRSANVVKGASSNGFVAVKITALTNPQLLEKMSKVVVELRNLFLKFDKNKTGMINADDFQRGYNYFFSGEQAAEVFDLIDTDHRGLVDYVSWSNSITIEDLHLLTSQCREKGPLFHATFSDHERDLLLSFRNRVRKLAKLADELGVSMMIDAEHTYFQPAIDNVAITLMKEFNASRPVIFSTYQMYLVDSEWRLQTDLNRAKQGNYYFAAKLVRGAYMELERHRAKELHYDDPIHESKEATDDNYNRNVESVVKRMAQGEKIEMMIASHNQQSVEHTLRYAEENGLANDAPIHFAQLMGMADNLTFLLGHANYKAYKYVPYGAVKEVMPYLVRRAQENSGLMGGAASEIKMLSTEIKARVTGRR